LNLTSLSGFAVAAAILWFGVFHPAPHPGLFLDPHALLIVLGGTLAAALIAFPLGRLADLGHLFVYGFLLKKHSDNRQIATELIAAAAAARLRREALLERNPHHPFLTEGYQLIGEGIIPERQLRDILLQRSDFFKKEYLADAKTLTSLAKFPPAFGLLGTSTGMITMMVNLGQGGQDSIGPAMASALVATFWGIALANLLILPLADYASKVAGDDSRSRKLIVEGLMMIKQGKSPILVAEFLNGHLPVHQRVRLILEDDRVGFAPRSTPLRRSPEPPAPVPAPAADPEPEPEPEPTEPRLSEAPTQLIRRPNLTLVKSEPERAQQAQARAQATPPPPDLEPALAAAQATAHGDEAA
jgi:chemotaxis protein MotA